MARTKQEVRDFLNSQVGQKVNAKAGIYNGQCVSLIKALLEFLGVPNPYAARGDAIYVNDTLLRQGIAQNGKGWLTIVVNRDMGYIDGVHYGHIWIDLRGEANFEQNGARALYTTKNTRPLSQGQQFVNLDKYIEENMDNPQDIRNLGGEIWGRAVDEQTVKNLTGKSWHDVMYYLVAAYPWTNRKGAFDNAQKDLANAQKIIDSKNVEITNRDKTITSLQKEIEGYKKQGDEDKQVADTWLRRLGQFLAKYWTTK